LVCVFLEIRTRREQHTLNGKLRKRQRIEEPQYIEGLLRRSAAGVVFFPSDRFGGDPPQLTMPLSIGWTEPRVHRHLTFQFRFSFRHFADLALACSLIQSRESHPGFFSPMQMAVFRLLYNESLPGKSIFTPARSVIFPQAQAVFLDANFVGRRRYEDCLFR
jgi:hypothetical protein